MNVHSNASRGNRTIESRRIQAMNVVLMAFCLQLILCSSNRINPLPLRSATDETGLFYPPRIIGIDLLCRLLLYRKTDFYIWPSFDELNCNQPLFLHFLSPIIDKFTGGFFLQNLCYIRGDFLVV